MPTTSAAALSALLTLSIVATPLAARAQTASAACKPVLDAKTKEISTPHHAYQTEESLTKEGPTKSSEVIATATASYVLVDGKWTRINVTPKDNLAQMQKNLHDAKVYECQKQPDAVISGVPMFQYQAHSKSDMSESHARLWVAKSTGLIYREDIDMYADQGDGKRHISTRYDYTNVQPPPGVK